MATFLFIMIVLALLALVVTLVVFTQRKKARLQNPHDSYHGRYRA